MRVVATFMTSSKNLLKMLIFSKDKVEAQNSELTTEYLSDSVNFCQLFLGHKICTIRRPLSRIPANLMSKPLQMAKKNDIFNCILVMVNTVRKILHIPDKFPITTQCYLNAPISCTLFTAPFSAALKPSSLDKSYSMEESYEHISLSMENFTHLNKFYV